MSTEGGAGIGTNADVKGQPGHRFRKHVGILRSTAMAVNATIGIGIWLSPGGIGMSVGSVGASMLVWVFCGLYTMAYAMPFVELSSMLPLAGGLYTYVYAAYGPMAAFSVNWAEVMVGTPVSIVIYGRTVGLFLMRFAFPHCQVPEVILVLVALAVSFLIAYINGVSIDVASRLQVVASVLKVLGLVLLSAVGVVSMANGYTTNLSPAASFEGSKTGAGDIAAGIYFGLYAYAGWTLPISLVLSLGTITLVYILTNAAYFTVMTVDELGATPAAALTFGERTISDWTWIIAVFVALSAAGAMSIVYMSYSRTYYGMARTGVLPRILSMLHANSVIPTPAIMVIVVLSSCYMPIENIYFLMNLTTVVVQFQQALGVSTFFYFRWKKPDWKRPIRVNPVIPAVSLLVSVVLMVLTCVWDPTNYGIGVLAFLSAFPVYLTRKYILDRSKTFGKLMDTVTCFLQQLLFVAKEDALDSDKIYPSELDFSKRVGE